MSAENPLVPIEVVAKKFMVSVSTVRVWLRTGAIPPSAYVKIGNTYRFDLDGVVEGLKAKTAEDAAKKEAVAKTAIADDNL